MIFKELSRCGVFQGKSVIPEPRENEQQCDLNPGKKKVCKEPILL